MILKNDKELKGLVVEKHSDRIIFSTEKGELPILLSGIKKIEYDDPAQNFMEVGKAYEKENKLGEALAYYEKALELNPGFEDARKAAAGVRNRFWAMSTEGPKSEMEKQQLIYDSWGKGKKSSEEVQKNPKTEYAAKAREGLGISLERRGDWAVVEQVVSTKDAYKAGLRRGDRLAILDGESLRYLTEEVILKKMILPHYSNFSLEYDHNCFIRIGQEESFSGDIGIKFKLDYQGVFVEKIKPDSLASKAGLKEGDRVLEVNGAPTRYLPLKQIQAILKNSKKDSIVITVRRSALLSRR